MIIRSLLLILHFGLFCLSARVQRAYRVIEDKLPWSEAQSYCRAHYIDLATVSDEEQFNLLINVTQRNSPLGHIWTGLYDDINSWRWSFQKEGYYDGGLDQFRLWAPGQPSNNNVRRCGVMLLDGTWKADDCGLLRPYICYSASAPQKFQYFSTLRSWSKARSYCQQYHTDLASIRNQAENDQVYAVIYDMFVHIGLYRDSWKWSDSSPVSFKNVVNSDLHCVTLYNTSMVSENCTTPYPFVCNDYPVRQVVKVKVTKNSALNLETVTESMLEQLKMILMKNGLEGNLRLTWKKQSDGNIFGPE